MSTSEEVHKHEATAHGALRRASHESSIEEMREFHDRWCVVCTHTGYRCAEKRLFAEIDRLRGALQGVADARCLGNSIPPGCTGSCVTCQARVALSPA